MFCKLDEGVKLRIGDWFDCLPEAGCYRLPLALRPVIDSTFFTWRTSFVGGRS